MDICAVYINKTIPESVFQKLFRCMSPEKQARYKRFHRIEDSHRLLAADILVRYYLCRKYGFKNKALVFEKNAYGKPFPANDPKRHFNVSHSGDWVLAAFDDDEVGVDIQRMRPIDMGVAEKNFSEKEYRDLIKKDGVERERRFYEIWTLKESFIKAVGQGLSLGLGTFSFEIRDEKILFESQNPFDDYFF